MIAIEKISLAQYQKDRLDTAPGTQMTLPQLEEEYAGIIPVSYTHLDVYKRQVLTIFVPYLS